jgi:hypothetical protein
LGGWSRGPQKDGPNSGGNVPPANTPAGSGESLLGEVEALPLEFQAGQHNGSGNLALHQPRWQAISWANKKRHVNLVCGPLACATC